MIVNAAPDRYSRHDNDAEIQPVPGIPQKREFAQAEASS